MEEKERYLSQISDIRKLMDRSARFISLSGLSGVFAGIYALCGAAAARWYLLNYGIHVGQWYHFDERIYLPYNRLYSTYTFFLVVILAVFVLSVGTGIFLTTRKARQNGQKIWDKTAQRMLLNLFVPLVAGGLFCLILVFKLHYANLVSSSMLIFYGLALVNASTYTLSDIRYLGYWEILIGLVCAAFPGYGLLCWSLGFGVFHIIYGIIMYFRHERNPTSR